MSRPHWLPQKSFPPYAYLPSKKPHPVRDPTGHSYHVEPIPVVAEASLGSETFLWSLDLFNHGYYWEAHEAWEGLWQGADRDGPLRMLFKGVILLSAAGIKIREGKHAAAVRHTGRAAALFRRFAAPLYQADGTCVATLCLVTARVRGNGVRLWISCPMLDVT